LFKAGWNVQWLGDESLFARQVTGEVQFFDPLNISSETHPSAISRLKVEGLKSFSLSPNKAGKFSVAVFIGEKKGCPAAVKLFDTSKLDGQTPLIQRTFFNADSVDFLWSEDGKHWLQFSRKQDFLIICINDQTIYQKA
jgi:uncharacterized protein with WD repeat